jgi:hypothetical protein
MKIDKFKGQLDEKEYLFGMSIQLVYLNKFLFNTEHEQQENWLSFTFPCIKDERSQILKWNYRYAEDCLLKNSLLNKD